MTESPRVYVACLAAYNNGTLYGEWIDATLSEEDILLQIEAMLAKSPVCGAEEWAIHDYEGFGDIKLSENPDLEDVSKMANLIQEHGDLALVALAHSSDVEEAEEMMTDKFEGTFSSLSDWAENFMESTGGLSEVPENLRYYFDFEKYARDCELGGDIWSVNHNGELFVFHN